MNRNVHTNAKAITLIFLFITLLTAIGSNDVFAIGENYDESGFRSNKTYIQYSPQEYINPFSGNLVLSHTDVELPGNGGLDLKIQRTYNSKLFLNLESSEISGIRKGGMGIGWTFHFGRIVEEPNSVNGFLLYLETPDGSIHRLYKNNHSNINSHKTSHYITEDFWVVNYDGAGYVMTLPDGTVYTFGRRVNYFGSIQFYVTSIKDKNENEIMIDYYDCCNMTSPEDPNSGALGLCPNTNFYGQTPHIKQVTDSVGRAISFGMLTDVCRANAVSSINVNGKIYSYSYYTGNDGRSPGYLLKEVQPPVGPGWKYFYDFDGMHPEGELISVTYPSGGVVEYKYGTFNLTVKGNDNQTQTFKFRAITTRTSSGPNITPGTWTYFYSPSSNQDSTTVTDACGNKEAYKFYGLRENSYAGNWAIGLVNERQNRDSYDNVSQSENNAWIPYQISVDLNIPEEGYFVPRLGSKTVTRDGNTYVTNFLYNTFYGSPTRIEEFGELARTTDITYYENLTGGNYIIDKPLVTTVTVGTDTKTIANSYDSLGNLLLENRYGVITESSYHPDGNLAWEKNSRGIYTHFDQYSYGVAGRIRYGSTDIAGNTSIYTETRSINWEGTVASFTNGRGHQTLFSYDELNRLIGIDPPPSGEAQTLISYDNTNGRDFIIKKGISETRYDLDGLGRPIGTFSNAGVLTETRYDQCGRKVYQSLPFAFDGLTPNRGENFNYDALGRVISITHPDSTSINYSYLGNSVTIKNERNLNKTLNFKSFGDPEDKRLVGIRDALNNITSYEYDVFGNAVRIDSPQGGDRVFTYNSKNLLVSETHPENGTTIYTYDEVGNVTSKTDAKNQKIQYQYDALNRLTFVDHPLGEDDVIYAYDNANNRTLMESGSGSYSYSYVYDESNRLTRQDVGLGGINYSVNFVYDERNNLVQATYPSGEIVNYSYDTVNRVLDIYDAASNLFAGLFTYHPSGAPTSYTNSFGVVSDFTYDSRHRLNTLKISRTFPFLMIEKDGLGGGTIDSDYPGINCGNDCTEKFPAENIQVTLTATPDPDSNFVGWSGDPDCLDGILVMDGVKTCIATFALKPVQNTLMVNKGGTGGGVVNSNPAGINCGNDCTENYDFNTQVSLTATPDSGSEFAGWTGDTDCSDGIVTMDTAKTCNAAFDLIPVIQHTLTVQKTGSGTGTVTGNPTGINCGTDCVEDYNENAQITLTATADAGSRFSGWHANSNQDCFDGVVTMDMSKTCMPVFIKRATITIEKSGTGSGTVVSYFGTTGNKINCGNVCSSEYDVGDTIVFEKTPDPNSQFTGWETCTALNNYSGFEITSDTKCIARFDLLQGSVLIVEKQGNGSGRVTSTPGGIDCGSDCGNQYDENTQVTLTAIPNSGSIFAGWNGDPDCSDGVVTMDVSKTCTATFTQSTQQFRLRVEVHGFGHVLNSVWNGIFYESGKIDCFGLPGSFYYNYCLENLIVNSQVKLVAYTTSFFTLNPPLDYSSTFIGWSGDPDCLDGKVIMDADKTCIAIFTPYKLNVYLSGTGTGTVTKSPQGISCSNYNCSDYYNPNKQVTLTATPGSGSIFTGWSGDTDCSDGVVTMDREKTCRANFDLVIYTLAVSKSGTGSGKITSSPSGIDCGNDCIQDYGGNKIVSLTPAPDPGSVFEGWSGDADCSDGSVTMNTNKTCNAIFTLFSERFTLTVSKSGTGTGTVTSTLAGINCGTDCTEDFPVNTKFRLDAFPDAKSIFVGWSGDTDCSDGHVTMDRAKSCNAIFERGCNCYAPNAIVGTIGRDNLKGTSGNDIICGFEGDDTLSGGGGDDCLYGGAGNDTLKGGRGVDDLFGLDGNDILQGEDGNDFLDGGLGTDKLDGGKNADSCKNGETVAGCENLSSSIDTTSPESKDTLLADQSSHSSGSVIPAKYTDNKSGSSLVLVKNAIMAEFQNLLSKFTKKNPTSLESLKKAAVGQNHKNSSAYFKLKPYIKSLRLFLVSSLFSTSAYAQVVVPPTPFIDIEYSYDGAGNVTATLDHINLQNSHTMQYDSLDRLTGANGPWGPGSFNYDAIGNRLNKSIDTANQNYSYGSVDNLLDGYAHDVNGNVLEDGSFTYEYDSENRLIRVLSNGGVIVEYSYDGDGRRISKTAYGETTYYAYRTGLDVLTEFSAQGVPKHDYVYAGNKNIARVNFDGSGVKQGTSSYHTDHLGSSLAMTDESTTVVWGQTYLPFGDAYRGIGTQNNSHQYTGKEFDQDIGLYYYGARYYHAGLGRFMSVDPAPGVITDPQSWNRYAYVQNSPFKFVDPDGEFLETAWDAFNITLGVISLKQNLSQGNYLSAAIDGAGIVVDGAAAIAPFVPGGIGLAIKAGRFEKAVTK